MALSQTAVQIIVTSIVFISVLLIAQILKMKFCKCWNLPIWLFQWTTFLTAFTMSAICYVIIQYNKILTHKGPPGPPGLPGEEGEQGPSS